MKNPIYSISVDTYNCKRESAHLGPCVTVNVSRGAWKSGEQNIKFYNRVSQASLRRAQRAQLALLER